MAASIRDTVRSFPTRSKVFSMDGDMAQLGDRAGRWSIRINNQYRVCFEFRGGDAYEVEITDYH